MLVYLAVAAGGALGAMSRYWVYTVVQEVSQFRFPAATLVVNLAGSLLIGVFYVVLTEKLSLSPEWRGIIVVGYLGGFTTFSTFSLDALLLMQDGQFLPGLVYILLSVVSCILAAWLGIVVMRALLF